MYLQLESRNVEKLQSSLMYWYVSPVAFGPLQSQHDRNHQEKDDPQHFEIVEKGQHGCLLLDDAIDHSVSTASGIGGAGAAGNKNGGETGQVVTKGGVHIVDVVHELRHMELGAALEHGGNRGDADAGTDVASKVDDAGAHVCFFLGHKGKGGDVDRDEEKRQTEALQHAAVDGVFVVEIQVPTSHDE